MLTFNKETKEFFELKDCLIIAYDAAGNIVGFVINDVDDEGDKCWSLITSSLYSIFDYDVYDSLDDLIEVNKEYTFKAYTNE